MLDAYTVNIQTIFLSLNTVSHAKICLYVLPLKLVYADVKRLSHFLNSLKRKVQVMRVIFYKVMLAGLIMLSSGCSTTGSQYNSGQNGPVAYHHQFDVRGC